MKNMIRIIFLYLDYKWSKIDLKAGCITRLNEDKPQVFEINLLEEEEGSLCKLQIKLS